MHITIIGLGLIGGSLGLALKRAGWRNAHITGYARKSETGIKAVEAGAVDSFEINIEKAVGGAGLIIIATPVFTAKDIFSVISPHVEKDCIVTDVASTKTMIMRWADEMLPAESCFVGGHPMAGKELSGIEAADSDLFRDCIYCLVKGNQSTADGLSLLRDMITTLGAKPLEINADDHDKYVAAISHLPLIASTALVQTTTGHSAWPAISELASSGYRDVTRLASGSPDMHAQICLSNREAIISWINAYIKELTEIRELINDADDAIEDRFKRARKERDKWIKKRYPGHHA